ncbi:hypothetical protein Mia14_0278 [Candidatus Mancarchaeum acidiphilum]|uniref:Uncharacterized protein n=1 Tax=Candidatus Mancarchaeum acidiphilum TaxID=1920749 RepID=A0A218NMC0_9ARCH|nr:hypothetical protein [Candidatus Mancarchaeum acidiphilum]ASI13608.1 hypothetical protein Mia14_0278 [Candidatus Mancarchaeum acidiphilum]
MISGFVISKVDGKLDSVGDLANQRFPKLNINFDSVEKEDKKLKVDYTFTASYSNSEKENSKEIGSIGLSGYITIEDTAENIEAAVSKWKSKHTLPVNIAEEIINGLNFRCSATGTLIAYSLGLIPPLVISQTKIEEPKEEGSAK